MLMRPSTTPKQRSDAGSYDIDGARGDHNEILGEKEQSDDASDGDRNEQQQHHHDRAQPEITS